MRKQTNNWKWKIGNMRHGDAVLKERGREGKTMRHDYVKINRFPRYTIHIQTQKNSPINDNGESDAAYTN
jgi:hypothetical protein